MSDEPTTPSEPRGPTEPTGGPRHLFDQVLEFAVYVPLGAALRVAEQVPDWASTGRAVAGRQIDNARVIGRFAVGAARRQVEQRIARQPADESAGPEPQAASTPASFAPAAAAPAEPSSPAPSPVSEDAPASGVGATPARGEVASESLAVPGYDALAASQVLPLLDGLSASELEAVRHYEEANRARRTVLGRIAQLQQERPDDDS